MYPTYYLPLTCLLLPQLPCCDSATCLTLTMPAAFVCVQALPPLRTAVACRCVALPCRCGAHRDNAALNTIACVSAGCGRFCCWDHSPAVCGFLARFAITGSPDAALALPAPPCLSLCPPALPTPTHTLPCLLPPAPCLPSPFLLCLPYLHALHAPATSATTRCLRAVQRRCCCCICLYADAGRWISPCWAAFPHRHFALQYMLRTLHVYYLPSGDCGDAGATLAHLKRNNFANLTRSSAPLMVIFHWRCVPFSGFLRDTLADDVCLPVPDDGYCGPVPAAGFWFTQRRAPRIWVLRFGWFERGDACASRLQLSALPFMQVH